ncbi:MAG: DUF2442 domain-containing protein [Magnetococcus sp. DMHC-1]
MNSWKITKVTPVTGVPQLDILWEDGYFARVDLSRIVALNAETARLGDMDYFQGVTIIDWGWGVGWSDDLDLGADNLRTWAEEQNRARTDRAGKNLPTAPVSSWAQP